MCGDQRDVMLPVFSQCNSHTDSDILYTLYNKGMAQLSWYENIMQTIVVMWIVLFEEDMQK